MTTKADQLRARLSSAPVRLPPPPWRGPHRVAIGGLLGVGFAAHPDTWTDLLLVASSQGRGLFDCASGNRVARDRDDYGDLTEPDLSCDGIGILAGIRVRMAGLSGGGLHQVTSDGWIVDIAAPDWPGERVILSLPGHTPYSDPDRGGWQVVHDESPCELRAAGFSPSGMTLVIASSCDIALFTRP